MPFFFKKEKVNLRLLYVFIYFLLIWYLIANYGSNSWMREVYPYLVDRARDAAARGGVTHVAWVVRPGAISGHLRGDIRRKRLTGFLLHAGTNEERLEPFANDRCLFADLLDRNDPDSSHGTCRGSDHLFLIEQAIEMLEPPLFLSLSLSPLPLLLFRSL